MSAKARNRLKYQLMIYKLFFIKSSQKEWDKLSSPIKEQFRKKLIKRLENPHVPKDKLSGLDNFIL